MFPGWQSNSRSNALTFTMSSLYYLDLICVSAFWSQCNRSAHASVSGRVTLTESEQEIAFISDFVRVFDVSLQQYLPIITNESEHRFINPQAKEPTLSKNILIFGWIRHVPCWGGSLFKARQSPVPRFSRELCLSLISVVADRAALYRWFELSVSASSVSTCATCCGQSI